MTPIIPHFTHECLNQLNVTKEIMWPKFDTSLLIKKEFNIVIQINGKKRDLITTDKELNEKELLVKINENPKILKFLENAKIKKTIFVQNKLINLII